MKTFRMVRAASAFATIFATAFLLHGVANQDRSPAATDLLTYSQRDLQLHALRTFAELTTGDHPAWEDEARGWRDQCDVGLMPRGCKPLSRTAAPSLHFMHSLQIAPQVTDSLQIAPQALLAPLATATPTDAFPSVLQTIYYNHSASRTIELNKLSDGGQLQSRLDILNQNSAPLSDTTVADFAPDAVVVKTFWEVIYGPSNERYARGAALFHKGLKFDKTGKYPILNRWTSDDAAMLIDTEDKDSCKSSVHEEKHLVYSLGCFEFRPVTESEVSRIPNLPTASRTIFVPSNYEARYLILVAVHIMTRETPNWVWMTFWWSNQWWGGPHPSPAVQNKWQLFKANATVNNTDPVANPYLEGPNSGMYSNCLECHRHAVFHPGYGSGLSTQSVPPGGGDPVSRYFTGIAGGDVWNPVPFTTNDPLQKPNIPVGLRDLQSPSCYFGGALQTHFLWTVALNVPQGRAKDPCPAMATAAAEK